MGKVNMEDNYTPTFDENEDYVPSFEENEDYTPSFDDTKDYVPSFDDTVPNDEEAPVVPSKLQSVLGGAQQAATAGFSDEMTGGIQAAMDKGQQALNALGLAGPSVSQANAALAAQGMTGDIGPTSSGDIYSQARDEERAKLKQMEEANPGSYLAGNLLGGLASAPLMPGANLVKGGGILAGAANAVVPATIAGVGLSNADTAGGVASDALTGATTGAVTGGILGGLGKGISTLKNFRPVQSIGQSLGSEFKTAAEGTDITAPDFMKNSRGELKQKASEATEEIQNKLKDIFAKKEQVLDRLEKSGIKNDVTHPLTDFAENVTSNPGLLDDEKKILEATINKELGKGIDRSPRELENLLKTFKDLKGSVRSPEGYKAVDSIVNELKDIRNQQSAVLPKADQLAGQGYDLGEALGKANPMDYQSGAENLALNERLANTLEKNATDYKTQSRLDDIINGGMNTSKSDVMPLQRFAPKAVDKLNEAGDIAKKMQMSRDASQPLFSSPTGGMLGDIAGAVGSLGKGTARVAGKATYNVANSPVGQTVSKVATTAKEGLEKGIANLTDMTPEALQNLAAQMSDSGFSKVLNDISTKQGVSKNAAIYSLMSNPEFRKHFNNVNGIPSEENKK